MKLGFSILGYFLFFNEEDATKILNEHVNTLKPPRALNCPILTARQPDSVESLFFTTDNDIKKKYQGAPGGLRTWLTENKVLNLPDYLTVDVRYLAVVHKM